MSKPAPTGYQYNPQWMDDTFRNRKEAQSLLGPEVQNGNLSRRDYDALMTTLPGFRFTEFTGAAVSAAALLLTSARAQQTKIIGGYILGLTLGKGIRIYQHQSLFNGLENVAGFERAMDNVKEKVGYKAGAVVLVRPLSAFGDTEQPFQPETETPYMAEQPMAEQPQLRAAQVPSGSAPSSPQPKSRWDEIRAARRVDGPGKAWENIRQGRRPDGSPLPRRAESKPWDGERQSSEPFSFRDTDRAVEQANFDAMLERERKMSSS
ncbi:hypothetical protein C8F04DRAFT_1254081 [Mycena alexandri]|uniref:Uncharacterized protein n=1 Tax=Mycena alexandri TaxID=1745969 RepID=A0AAD6T6Z8_9AGAR|nr:hypothetical protein C8F04DRAFT_1254081 [Mycena alexandri]